MTYALRKAGRDEKTAQALFSPHKLLSSANRAVAVSSAGFSPISSLGLRPVSPSLVISKTKARNTTASQPGKLKINEQFSGRALQIISLFFETITLNVPKDYPQTPLNTRYRGQFGIRLERF